MSDTLVLPGQHPVLALAELFALGAATPESVRYASPDGYVVAGPLRPDLFARLGGAVKSATVVAVSPAPGKEALLTHIAAYLQAHAGDKFRFGISFAGYGAAAHDAEEMAFLIKSAVADKSARYVLPKAQNQTTAAQILHQKLLPPDGYDFTVLLTDGPAYIARTERVQDIESYRLRDEGRPHRIRSEGMMPLKLSQMLINLASPAQAAEKPTLLDPFCGSGTILQEALLAGFDVIGSDLSPEAVARSEANLAWFRKYILHDAAADWSLLAQDARHADRALLPGSVDAIVSEGFLGALFVRPPDAGQIAAQNKQLAPLYRKAFTSFYRILRPGGKIALTLPYYLHANVSLAEQILDDIRAIGYTSQSLLPDDLARAVAPDTGHGITPRGTYVYARPDQIIGREIVLLGK